MGLVGRILVSESLGLSVHGSLFLAIAAGQAGAEHVFFQAAVFQEVLFLAAEELVEQGPRKG